MVLTITKTRQTPLRVPCIQQIYAASSHHEASQNACRSHRGRWWANVRGGGTRLQRSGALGRDKQKGSNVGKACMSCFNVEIAQFLGWHAELVRFWVALAGCLLRLISWGDVMARWPIARRWWALCRHFLQAGKSVEGRKIYVFDLYRWPISTAPGLFAYTLAVGPRRRWNAKTPRADICYSGPLPHGSRVDGLVMRRSWVR